MAANQRPDLTRVFSTFEASTPQVRLEIDRDKVQVLGVKLSDVFAALQATLGGYYINDFNMFGRTWTVRMLAEQAYRASIDAIYRIQVKNKNGEMIPLSALARATIESGPKSIVRYNNYRAVAINGSPSPGSGDGDAIAAMEAVSSATLPPGYAYEWTGTALEQKLSAGQTPIVIGFAIVFAFLFLVALYESWNVPIPVLMSVVVAILGAMAALYFSHMSFVLYAQIGIVVLIALAAKNDSNDGIFARPTRRGPEHQPVCGHWGASEISACHDDELRFHRGAGASGAREGSGCRQHVCGRPSCSGRDDCCIVLWHIPYPDALCGIPEFARSRAPQGGFQRQME